MFTVTIHERYGTVNFYRINILILLTSEFKKIFILYIYICSLSTVSEREHKLTAVNLTSRLQVKHSNERHRCSSNLQMNEGRPESNATHSFSHSQLILLKLQIYYIIT